MGARDHAGYRTCSLCGRDLLDERAGVVGVEQSSMSGRWHVTEDGYRVSAVDHPTEQLALAAAEQLRAGQRLVPARS